MHLTTPIHTSPEVPEPTVVLVHGAFADSSCWTGVIKHLLERNVQVRALANPLRGVATDSLLAANAIAEIPGRVLLVGHGYGGVVISNAATRTSNVIGLVFVAGFIPDDGEVVNTLLERSGDSQLVPALVQSHHPMSLSEDAPRDLTVLPHRFRDVLAADLPAAEAAILAITQRPVATTAFNEPSGLPAWKTIPSWAVVPTRDMAAGTDLVRDHAERAKAIGIEIEASHFVPISQPVAVADLIYSAFGTVS